LYHRRPTRQAKLGTIAQIGLGKRHHRPAGPPLAAPALGTRQPNRAARYRSVVPPVNLAAMPPRSRPPWRGTKPPTGCG
jgi:hypothetical protein